MLRAKDFKEFISNIPDSAIMGFVGSDSCGYDTAIMGVEGCDCEYIVRLFINDKEQYLLEVVEAPIQNSGTSYFTKGTIVKSLTVKKRD